MTPGHPGVSRGAVAAPTLSVPVTVISGSLIVVSCARRANSA
jgi:hypothetical protein